jgi:hypothetical protein
MFIKFIMHIFEFIEIESPKLKFEQIEKQKRKLKKIQNLNNSPMYNIISKSMHSPRISNNNHTELIIEKLRSEHEEENNSDSTSISSSPLHLSVFSKTIKLQKDFDAFLNSQNEINLHLQKMQQDYCQQLEFLESSTDLTSTSSQSDKYEESSEINESKIIMY